MTQIGNGMNEDSPHINIGLPDRQQQISNRVSIPNWKLIDRSRITDDEFRERYLMLHEVYEQMIQHTVRRKLIPPHAWEEICRYAVLKACTHWKGNDKENGLKRCPLKNYAWAILKWTSIQYWTRNKHTILDCLELDDKGSELESN